MNRAVAWDAALAHEVPVAPIAPGTETAVHLQCMAISTALSRYYVKHFITPEKVIDVLNAAGTTVGTVKLGPQGAGSHGFEIGSRQPNAAYANPFRRNHGDRARDADVVALAQGLGLVGADL